jgi:hypothetical protein
MGSDNLYHKRKAKASRDLKRREARLSSYDKVLIVCEGQKTEPNYFNEIIYFYKLNTANVEIDGSCGSSPESVLERAVLLAQEEDRKGDPFDRVYCVFDKDTHPCYSETLRKISNIKTPSEFIASISVPCFEYWLILHFIYTTKPYSATGTSSIGGEALRELKKYMPEYEKGNDNIFTSLSTQLDFAKANSERALNAAQSNNTDNPSTYIHQLVEHLQKLKSGTNS